MQMAIYTNFWLQQMETPKQNQNLPGLCHYYKTPAHWKKALLQA